MGDRLMGLFYFIIIIILFRDYCLLGPCPMSDITYEEASVYFPSCYLSLHMLRVAGPEARVKPCVLEQTNVSGVGAG